MERTSGFEPPTFCLASRRSTTELRPLTKSHLSYQNLFQMSTQAGLLFLIYTSILNYFFEK